MVEVGEPRGRETRHRRPDLFHKTRYSQTPLFYTNGRLRLDATPVGSVIRILTAFESEKMLFMSGLFSDRVGLMR